MSSLTYEAALRITKEYSNHECFSPANKRFFNRAMERMYFRGKHGSLIPICTTGNIGCVTLPEDVEHVEKAKINGISTTLYSYWYEFSSHNDSYFESGCSKIHHLPEKFFTQYDAPSTPFRVVTKARYKKENKDAYIIVHGLDKNGEKIFLKHEGNKLVGEYLPAKNSKYTQGTVLFSKITGIEKSVTDDYIDLYATNSSDELFLLSSYNPRETKPVYTRIKISGCPDNTPVKINLLARLKILPEYHCKELIPIVGTDVFETICQEIRLMKDNDFNSSVAAGAIAKELIRDENQYKYGNNIDIMDIVNFNTDEPGDVY